MLHRSTVYVDDMNMCIFIGFGIVCFIAGAIVQCKTKFVTIEVTRESNRKTETH